MSVVLRWLGRVMHRLGLPGLVRETRYAASIAEISVKVRTDPAFTVVSVNGVEVYFGRASGGIEGVGYACGHRWRVVPRADRFAAAPWL